MKKNKINALLAIDCQDGFCTPGRPLYVQNAEKSMDKLANWIRKNIQDIDDIFLTFDSHQPLHIAHPPFWRDHLGNDVKPNTLILHDDILNGKYTAKFYRERAHAYVKSLEDQGKFKHYIWPEHCEIGSKEHILDENLFAAVREWCIKNGSRYSPITKGENVLAEHFGFLGAQIPNEDPATQLNQKVIDILESYERVFLAGEAKSHCVATSLVQILDYAPSLAKKLVILEDVMDNVPGSPAVGLPTFEETAQPIYDRAKKFGIPFTNTKDAVLYGLQHTT